MTPDQGSSPPWSTVASSGGALPEGHVPDESQLSQPSPAASSNSTPMDTDSGRAIPPQGSNFIPGLITSDSFESDQSPRLQQLGPSTTQAPYLPSISQLNPGIYGRKSDPATALDQSFLQNSPPALTSSISFSPTSNNDRRLFPLEDVQDACLLRYYIEEISHWVSYTLV